MYKRFRNIIVIFSLCFFMVFSFNPQRANADIPLIAGVATVNPVAAAALAGVTLVACGAYATMTPAQRAKVDASFGSLADDVSNFTTTTLSGGRIMLGWTATGLANLKAKALSLFGANTVINIGTYTTYMSTVLYAKPSSTSATVFTNTVPYTSVYIKITDSATGVTSNCTQVLHNVGDTLTATVGWVDSSTFVTCSTAGILEHVNISATVEANESVCADNVLNKDKINSLPVDSIPYGIPVSNTGSIDAPVWSPTASDPTYPDVLSGQPIPDGYTIPTVPPGTATGDGSTTVPPGTGTATGDGTGTGTGTGTTTGDTTANPDTTGTIDTGTGVMNIPILGDILKILQKILDFLLNMIKTLVDTLIKALEDLITKIFIPSDTFFTEQFEDIKAPIINKFPGNLDILKALSVDGDEFNDISITIMGSTGIIVSAKYIHENISLIRSATSCFWLFLLVMYLWRKINAFVNGNEVIQPNVTNGGGGGKP